MASMASTASIVPQNRSRGITLKQCLDFKNVSIYIFDIPNGTCDVTASGAAVAGFILPMTRPFVCMGYTHVETAFVVWDLRMYLDS